MSVHRPTKEPAPSIGAIVGSVIGTVIEVGWSLVAAGRGAFSVAQRLVRLAQEQLGPLLERHRGGAPAVGPTVAGGVASGAGTSPGRASSSAAALDVVPVATAREPAPAPPPRHERRAPEVAGRGGAALEPAADEAAADPLPDRYGDDRFEVLVRDPETVFAWWEVTDAQRARVERELDVAGTAPEPVSEVLRLAAVDRGEAQTIHLPPLASSRYLEVPRTSGAWEISLGLLRGDRFAPLAPPRRVEMPASAISPDTSVRWRSVGETREEAGATAPPAEATAALWEEYRGRPLPSSMDRPAGHRLPDLDVGGSHGLPA